MTAAVQLATFSPRTAEQIYVRMTAMEKIDLRRASPDRVRFLTETSYQAETGKSIEILTKVQDLCNAEFQAFDNPDREWWTKPTYKF